MQVLALTNEFEEEHFGGAGTAATGMLHMLSQGGVSLLVVVPDSKHKVPSWDVRPGIKILRLPRSEAYFGYLGLADAQKILGEFPELRENWDLIHIHAINFAPLAYAVSEGRIPLLYSVYSVLREELGNNPAPELQAQFAVQDELLNKCRRIHLISRNEVNYLSSGFPELLTKIKVVPLGIHPPQVSWSGGKPNNLLYIGRLIVYKGIEDLLKALYLVKQSGRSFTLDIVGKGTEEYENRLKILVQSQKLGSNVRFHGWVTDRQSVAQRMKRSGLLIVPSRKESYGLAALEGMAAGVPLIASNAGGLAELANPACALTFEAGNIGQLVQALNKALDNPALMRTLARNARKRAAVLEWSNLFSKYLDLLTDIN